MSYDETFHRYDDYYLTEDTTRKDEAHSILEDLKSTGLGGEYGCQFKDYFCGTPWVNISAIVNEVGFVILDYLGTEYWIKIPQEIRSKLTEALTPFLKEFDDYYLETLYED